MISPVTSTNVATNGATATVERARTLLGMRRPADAEFCLVRVGVGTLPLATRLVAPETRARLVAHFADSNQRLENLLGSHFTWGE